MSSFNHIKEILEQLSPLEVIEMCGLDEDAAVLTEALSDWVEDNQEDIEERLIENSLLDEEGDE